MLDTLRHRLSTPPSSSNAVSLYRGLHASQLKLPAAKLTCSTLFHRYWPEHREAEIIRCRDIQIYGASRSEHIEPLVNCTPLRGIASTREHAADHHCRSRCTNVILHPRPLGLSLHIVSQRLRVSETLIGHLYSNERSRVLLDL